MADEKGTKRFYCTFGQDHHHEIGGVIYDKDVVLEIEAPNKELAHVLMFKYFNSKWSMCYETRPVPRMMALFPGGIIPFPPEEALVDLGWANSWKEEPGLVEKCRSLGHERRGWDAGPPNRGLEHVVICDICKYVYRYDSSD